MTRPLPPAKIEYDERYVLRPVEPGDVPQIEEALHASLPDLRKYMTWSHYPLSREKFLERVLAQQASYFKGADYELALFDKETGRFYVYTGFYPVNRINPLCMEVGFWTDSREAGKGYATLATQIQMALLTTYFKSDRIEITCSVENAASRQVIEKCGFRLEGKLQNFYPKGTPNMYKEGYVESREAFLYAITQEICSELPWYREVVEKVSLFPLLDPPQPLVRYAG